MPRTDGNWETWLMQENETLICAQVFMEGTARARAVPEPLVHRPLICFSLLIGFSSRH